jgi:hypothetical protein
MGKNIQRIYCTLSMLNKARQGNLTASPPAALGVMHQGEKMDLNFQYSHNSHSESETKKNITTD